MELIDKFAVVAEIKERIETYNKGYANGDDIRADALEVLLHDIDTIEVKEVDLEKEITPSSVENMLCYFGVQSIDDMDSENLAEFARHFFELGLKAQKGE